MRYTVYTYATTCRIVDKSYDERVPKLWEASIDEHRRAVSGAITEAAWQLAEEHGPLTMTMSQVASAAGIGRATLYKYFPDVESILIAHHAHHVEDHLRTLEQVRAGSGPVGPRLVALVHTYALIRFGRARHSSTDVSALVHRGPAIADAERRLRHVFGELIDEAAGEDLVRTDVGREELAAYCLHAVSAAVEASDPEQLEHLVRLVLDGLGCSLDVHVGEQIVAGISHDPVARRPH